MKNTQVLSYVLALIMLLVSESSYATLINRGGGLIYDDVLNVTWLANTNLGAGSVYDDGFSSTDGLMFGASAINWADQLSHGGFDDWRLPKATYTNSAGQSCHYYCTDSELGYMFYVNLGVSAGSSVTSSTNANLQLFENLTNGQYWNGSSDPYSTDMGSFRMGDGLQIRHSMNYHFLSWAVRDGDVATIPEPSTFYLLFVGFLALLMKRSYCQ